MQLDSGVESAWRGIKVGARCDGAEKKCGCAYLFRDARCGLGHDG